MKTAADMKSYLEFDIWCFVDDVRNNPVFFHGFRNCGQYARYDVQYRPSCYHWCNLTQM